MNQTITTATESISRRHRRDLFAGGAIAVLRQAAGCWPRHIRRVRSKPFKHYSSPEVMLQRC
jgi:hypothetical protein